MQATNEQILLPFTVVVFCCCLFGGFLSVIFVVVVVKGRGVGEGADKHVS